MIHHYQTLELTTGATDAEIRKAYLRLVKINSPEKHPVRFKQITAAYEAIKDVSSRVSSKINGGFACRDIHQILQDLTLESPYKKKRIGLSTMVKIINNPR